MRSHLSGRTLPPGWEWLPLWQLVEPGRPITYGIVQAGPDVADGVPYIRPVDMTDEHGLKPGVEPRRTSPDIAAAYARSVLAADDLVVTIGPSYGKVMLVPSALVGANLTQGTARVAPHRAEVDGRYLKWALRSLPVRDAWATAVGGATFGGLNLGPLADSLVPVPPLPGQRRIADYLDTETARVDRLISKNDEVLRLLDERRQALISRTVIGPPGGEYPNRPLRYVARRITVGIVVEPAKLYVDGGGVPALRGLNVQPGEVTPDAVVHISESANRTHAKSILREGDVVVVRTGKAGAAAVVPAWALGGNAIDLLIVSPGPDVVPRFLEYTLNSDVVREQVAAGTVGAIQGHFNVATLREVELPIPHRNSQLEAVQMLDVSLKRQTQLGARVRRQQSLLQERRQALITAAVTGELEV